jgi:hypothetical protein
MQHHIPEEQNPQKLESLSPFTSHIVLAAYSLQHGASTPTFYFNRTLAEFFTECNDLAMC